MPIHSTPEENYLDHISRCKEKFEVIFPIFISSLKRVFDYSNNEENLKNSFLKMVLFHDLGKLTKRWQDNLGTNRSLPSHSTLGAAYLWKILPNGLKEPISFAVAIHHTDRGLLGDNIEKPDVQAIMDGIVDNGGSIQWHDEAFNLDNDLFPEDAKSIKINDLREMARGLRVWAKGCGLLEQHQRRIEASFAHHILKLCDISAATERKEYKKKDEKDHYGGWLMVENIKNYVDAIGKRKQQ